MAGRGASTHAEPIVKSKTNMAAITWWIYMWISKLSGLERIYEHLYVPTGKRDRCAGVDWLVGTARVASDAVHTFGYADIRVLFTRSPFKVFRTVVKCVANKDITKSRADCFIWEKSSFDCLVIRRSISLSAESTVGYSMGLSKIVPQLFNTNTHYLSLKLSETSPRSILF